LLKHKHRHSDGDVPHSADNVGAEKATQEDLSSHLLTGAPPPFGHEINVVFDASRHQPALLLLSMSSSSNSSNAFTAQRKLQRRPLEAASHYSMRLVSKLTHSVCSVESRSPSRSPSALTRRVFDAEPIARHCVCFAGHARSIVGNFLYGRASKSSLPDPVCCLASNRSARVYVRTT
jgi:hypothetical protein